MNLRSRQVWRADRCRHHADTPHDHYRRHPTGEPFLHSARRILAGAAQPVHYAQRGAPVGGLNRKWKMESTAEIKRRQSCINDLISVLALPAIWSGSESSQMPGTLLDVLLTMLRLDFAYARLSDVSDGPPIEVVRLGDHWHSSIQPQQFGQALDRWLTGDQTVPRSVIPVPGEAEVFIASFSLGLQHDVGVLVAGSRRADFPTEVERLLLRVAANQAGIGLQEARRSGEQKRIAEMLEQRVAEPNRQLTAVNDELRRSQAYLAEAQRLSRTGSFGWKVSTGEIIWAEV